MRGKVRERGIATGPSRAAAVAAAVTLALALTAVPAGAAAKKKKEITVDGSLWIEEGYTDNVRGDRLRRDGAWYTELGTEAEWQLRRNWLPDRVGGLVRSRIYAGYGNRDYAVFGPQFGWDWKRLSFDVDYAYSPDRLKVDPEAAIDAFADGHDLTGELKSKFGKNKRWVANMQFQFEADFYDPSFRGRSYYEETVEAGLRCRATDTVTPRAGFAYSWRDAISSNFDREEAKLLVGMDLYLPARVRSTFRFEKTWRNFLVGYDRDADGLRNSNYGREDDAYEFKAGLDVPVPRTTSIVVHLNYRYYENNSTREARSYDVNEGNLRISYDF